MAYDEIIVKGTTSKIIEVMLRDPTTGNGKTGIAYTTPTASYVREGSTRTAITLAAGTAGDAYSSGKWAEVDSTNCRGLYQLHIPNAALATGVNAVTITLKGTGFLDVRIRILLIDANFRDGAALGLSRIDQALSAVLTTALTEPADYGGAGTGPLSAVQMLYTLTQRQVQSYVDGVALLLHIYRRDNPAVDAVTVDIDSATAVTTLDRAS